MSLFDKRFVIVAGKGGVGRTTVAAALGLAASQRGLKTLICQTKSKERFSQIFGVRDIGDDIVEVRPKLSIVSMTPKAALREYGTMVLRSEFIAKQVLENRVTRSFLRAVPGLEDYAMLGKTWYHTTEQEGGRNKWDLVILDGPATGHLLTLLRIPQSILETIPEGPLTQSARDTQALLTDPRRTAAVIVTLAEDMPTNEAIELGAKLRAQIGVHLGPLVVNLLYPPRFTQGVSARALGLLPKVPEGPAGQLLAPLLQTARTSASRRQLNDHHLQRLTDEMKLPIVQLPNLFLRKLGSDAIGELARRLDGQVAALS